MTSQNDNTQQNPPKAAAVPDEQPKIMTEQEQIAQLLRENNIDVKDWAYLRPPQKRTPRKPSPPGTRVGPSCAVLLGLAKPPAFRTPAQKAAMQLATEVQQLKLANEKTRQEEAAGQQE